MPYHLSSALLNFWMFLDIFMASFSYVAFLASIPPCLFQCIYRIVVFASQLFNTVILRPYIVTYFTHINRKFYIIYLCFLDIM